MFMTASQKWLQFLSHYTTLNIRHRSSSCRLWYLLTYNCMEIRLITSLVIILMLNLLKVLICWLFSYPTFNHILIKYVNNLGFSEKEEKISKRSNSSSDFLDQDTNKEQEIMGTKNAIKARTSNTFALMKTRKSSYFFFACFQQ